MRYNILTRQVDSYRIRQWEPKQCQASDSPQGYCHMGSTVAKLSYPPVVVTLSLPM